MNREEYMRKYGIGSAEQFRKMVERGTISVIHTGQGKIKEVVDQPPIDNSEFNADDVDDMAFNELKAEELKIKVKKGRMELYQLEQKVIPVAEVLQSVSEASAVAISALNSFPDTYVLKLREHWPEIEPAPCKKILEDAIVKIREDFVRKLNE